jgi:hypothetical protein
MHVHRNGGTGDPAPALINEHYQPYEFKKYEQSRIPQNTKTSAQIKESIRLNGQNEGRFEHRHKALRHRARIHLFFFYEASLELFMRI